MSAIKATNSENLSVINCKFSGFETDIELDNVEGFLSDNNKFSTGNDPQLLLEGLVAAIKESKVPENAKKQLFQEIISHLQPDKLRETEKQERIKIKINTLLSSKALEFFIQLAANVAAGLIIKN